MVKCQCEHASHFIGHGQHEYLDAEAGTRRAFYVGAICDFCAETHLNEFLLED